MKTLIKDSIWVKRPILGFVIVFYLTCLKQMSVSWTTYELQNHHGFSFLFAYFYILVFLPHWSWPFSHSFWAPALITSFHSPVTSSAPSFVLPPASYLDTWDPPRNRLLFCVSKPCLCVSDTPNPRHSLDLSLNSIWLSICLLPSCLVSI